MKFAQIFFAFIVVSAFTSAYLDPNPLPSCMFSLTSSLLELQSGKETTVEVYNGMLYDAYPVYVFDDAAFYAVQVPKAILPGSSLSLTLVGREVSGVVDSELRVWEPGCEGVLVVPVVVSPRPLFFHANVIDSTNLFEEDDSGDGFDEELVVVGSIEPMGKTGLVLVMVVTALLSMFAAAVLLWCKQVSIAEWVIVGLLGGMALGIAFIIYF